jgi:alpha-1,2-mannosyltransferase
VTSGTTEAPPPARTLLAPVTLAASSRLRSLAGQLVRQVRDPVTWVWAIAIATVTPFVLHQLQVKVDPIIDLHVYRDAGLSLLHREPLYSHYTVTRYSVLPFTYPPFAAALAIPMAALPLTWVGAIWSVAVYLALLAVLRIVLVPVRDQVTAWRPSLEPYVLPLAWLGSAFLILGQQQVHYGQVGFFLMAMICVDLLTPKTGRWRGVLVGLATAIKLTPGVFIVALFVSGRRRAAGVATATAALVSGLTAIAAPASSRAYWTGALFDSDRLGQNSDATNQSLRGVLLRTGLDHRLVTVLFVVAVLVVGGIGLRKAVWAWNAGDDLLAVTIVGLLMALLSPVGWIHHFVFVIPLLVVLLRDHRWRAFMVLAALWSFNWPGLWSHQITHEQLIWLGWGRTLLASTLGLSALVALLWLPRARDGLVRP